MTMSWSSDSAAIWPELGLPDVVTEMLCEVAERDGKEFIVMWLPGECIDRKGESILSTMIDSPYASISFMHDCCGATWLTWQVHAQTTAGARRIDPSDDVNDVLKFVYGLLCGSSFGFRDMPLCH